MLLKVSALIKKQRINKKSKFKKSKQDIKTMGNTIRL